jgi:cytochrome P450
VNQSIDFDSLDFFTDPSLVEDPYPYYDFLRARSPVLRERHHGVVMVTGYDEAAAVYRDPVTFSSCNSVSGPFPGFPVPLVGEDVGALIDRHRDRLPMSDQLPTLDPPTHAKHRALLMKLLTPNRLKENEEFMWQLADRQIAELLEGGTREFISGYAKPFAMLVIADLLGVPEEDRAEFRAQLGGAHRPGRSLGSTTTEAMAQNPLDFLYRRFTDYVEQRRRKPRADVLTGLATATFPDGGVPDVIDVVRVAANLFAAGQETTVRLLASALQLIGERPDLERLLRAHRERIPNFVEEVLRFETPIKGDFRLSRVSTTLSGVGIPAGTTLMLLNGAANRDPRRFEHPAEFLASRRNARQHLAFGLGIHTCPGASLARAETRISIERLLDRTSEIRIAESEHGPEGARRYRYAPTFILRGLQALHLEYGPVP